MRIRTSKFDVYFLDSTISLVRLADGAPCGALRLDDEETRDAVVQLLNEKSLELPKEEVEEVKETPKKSRKKKNEPVQDAEQAPQD